MQKFGLMCNNFPMPIPLPQMFRPIPRFTYVDAIGFALRKSLTMFAFNKCESSLQIFSKTQNSKQDIVQPSLIEIEESPERNVQKTSIKSQKEQIRTLQDTPPLKKKISKTKKKIQISKKIVIRRSSVSQALSVQNIVEDKQNSMVLQQEQAIQYVDIPQFGMSQSQINKRRQELLLRRVFDWKQLQKIQKQKQKPKQIRQLKKLN